MPDTLFLMEEKVEIRFELINTFQNFLNRTTTLEIIRTTINKQDFVKLQSFCVEKRQVLGKLAGHRMGKDAYKMHI